MFIAFSELATSIIRLSLITGIATQATPLVESEGLANSGGIDLRSADGPWMNLQIISPEGLRETSSFGSVMDLDRDLLIVGAPNAAHDGISSGAAFIYRYNRIEQIWKKESILLPKDPEDGDRFGRSVSISQTHAAVGNDADDVGFSLSAGSVTIFEFNSQLSVWRNQRRIFASDSHPNQNFGSAVSLDDDMLLIGALGDQQKGENSGAAYIFSLDRDKQLWGERQKLVADDGDDFDWFGNSVALTGDSAIIGAMLDDENGQYSGSVYFFSRAGPLESWIQEQKLLPSDAGADMIFGNAVSIDGDYLLVGSRWADSGGRSDAGQAYIFFRSGDSMLWQEKHIVSASSPGSSANFGFSVAIAGEHFAIGTIWDRIDGIRSGSASVYRLGENGGSFEQLQTFSSLDSIDDNDFGSGVSLNQEFIFVGARGDDIGRGSTYVYFVPPIFKDGFEQ